MSKNSDNTFSIPPFPENAEELERVNHTRLRRRIMYGRHEKDIEERLQLSIGKVRSAAWGPIDMTSNPLNVVYTQLAALYNSSPIVNPPDGAKEAADIMHEEGYWSMMQRVQRDTLAMRAMAVRVDINQLQEVKFRTVFPDMMQVEVDAFDNNVPYLVKEWISNPVNTIDSNFVLLVTDTRNGGSYYAEDENGVDVSDKVLGGRFEGLTGDRPYPWIVDGIPEMPYVFYKASDSGWFWDAYTDREAVEGTLQASVLLSFYCHVVRNAAWAQRYAIGVEPSGAVGDQQQTSVVTDPSTLLMLSIQDDFSGQPVVGQWNSPTKPDELLESIMQYEQRIVETAIGYASASRTTSDIRSGYSLAVSREQQRDAQRRYEPLFRKSDIRMCKLVAGLLGLEEGKWEIRYRSIPKDPAQLKSEFENMKSLIEAGMMTELQAFQHLNPDLTADQAEEKWLQIQESRKQLQS